VGKTDTPPFFWPHKAARFCEVHSPLPSISVSPSSSPSSSPSGKLNPTAQEFCPNRKKQTHNPLGGKLVTVAVMFFERAYGLNGQKRVDHETLKEEMMSLTGCSERAVQAVLYGSSYNDLLGGLRAQIPNYMARKSSEIVDVTSLPFYNFDGNTVSTPAESAPSSPFSDSPCFSAPSDAPVLASSAVVSELTSGSESFLVTESLPTDSPLVSLDTATISDENVSKHYPTLILLALVAILPFTLLY